MPSFTVLDRTNVNDYVCFQMPPPRSPKEAIHCWRIGSLSSGVPACMVRATFSRLSDIALTYCQLFEIDPYRSSFSSDYPAIFLKRSALNLDSKQFSLRSPKSDKLLYPNALHSRRTDHVHEFMSQLLLITDDPSDYPQLASRLGGLNYAVSEMNTDRAQIAASLAQSPAELIVYVAYSAPAASSDELAALIVQSSRCPLLIVADANSHAEIDHPAVSYLAAPFSDRELRLSVDLALCMHRAAQSTRELNGFFSVAIDMFCFLDFGGYFKRLNPAWERVLGFTIAELMSKPFIEFVHPDDRARTMAQNAAVRAGGEAIGFENRYLHKDGSYRWLRWNARPLTVAGIIYSVARDITERKRVEDERAALIRTLEASLAEVNSLRDILPICMYCRNVRDDKDYWQSVESYISQHTATRFSHGICPSCLESEVEPQLRDLNQG